MAVEPDPPEETEEPDLDAEPGDETEGPEPEEETAEPETDEPESETEEPPARAREPRGRPDAQQRDARRGREARLQARIDRLERQLSQPQRPQPDFAQQQRALQEQRARELTEARNNGPEAYADVRDRHLREDFAAETQRRHFDSQDALDQARFDRLCDRDPMVENVRDEVENRIGALRAQGINPSNGQREAVANIVIGERMRQRASRAGGQQRRRAAEQNTRQIVRRPNNPASTVAARRAPRSVEEMSAEDFEAAFGSIPMGRFK